MVVCESGWKLNIVMVAVFGRLLHSFVGCLQLAGIFVILCFIVSAACMLQYMSVVVLINSCETRHCTCSVRMLGAAPQVRQ